MNFLLLLRRARGLGVLAIAKRRAGLVGCPRTALTVIVQTGRMNWGISPDMLHTSTWRAFGTSIDPPKSGKDSSKPTADNDIKVKKSRFGWRYEDSLSSSVRAPRTLPQKPLFSRIGTRSASMWIHFKAEMRQYWLGIRLLGADIKAAMRLLSRVLTGNELTRRQRLLLTRVAADLARLVPFLFFIIIPFMELLLPFAIRLFPNLLPSTFQTVHKKEERIKQQLKGRLELAKFLQETTEELAKDLSKSGDSKRRSEAEKLMAILARVQEGKHVANADIVELAQLFNDEFTLNRLQRKQLVMMSRYMGLPAYLSDNLLRLQLDRKFEQIRMDDRLIQREGIDSLNDSELRAANRDRGMRALGVSESVLRKNLEEWLDLSLKQSIPCSLMILSRSFTLNRVGDTANISAIKTTLASLDEELVDDVVMDSTRLGDNEHKLESRMREIELAEADTVREEARKASEQLKAKMKQQTKDAAEAAQKVPGAEESVTIDRIRHIRSNIRDLLKQDSAQLDPEKIEEVQGVINTISDELRVMSEESAVSEEQRQLELLRHKWIDLSESLDPDGEDVRAIRRASGEDVSPPKTNVEAPQTNAAVREGRADEIKSGPIESADALQKRLSSKVGDMLERLQGQIDKADSTIGNKLQLLDKNRDGVMEYEEIVEVLKTSLKDCSDEEARAIANELDLDRDGRVTTEQLREILRNCKRGSGQ